jgi:uncharacterized protein (TIGR02246 family)
MVIDLILAWTLSSHTSVSIMKQKFLMIGMALLFGTTLCSSSYSQTAVATPSTAIKSDANPSLDAIVASGIALATAFNQRDVKAVAALWTKDCEYIDESGQLYDGRDAIESLYTDLFANSDAKMQLITDAVRSLSDSVILEDGRAIVESTQAGSASISRFTAVHLKIDGKWLLASVRELGSDESAASTHLEDLEWLIGDWVAEENGVRMISKCRWIVDKKFVERSYSTTELDGTVTSGLQIIGWNAQNNHIQAWSFSADGGNAIGVWTATEDGWIAKVSGSTGTSVSTTAVNLLKKLDDNAYIWKSMDRTIGDVRLPDTDEVVIRRMPAAK